MSAVRADTIIEQAGGARDPALRLRGLERDFGGVAAVAGVDLEVDAGERRVVLGPNGAGKTTLLNLIAGDDIATSGRIELHGVGVTWLPARHRTRMGLSRTFQISRLFVGLTVRQHFQLALLGKGHGHYRPLRLPHRDRALEREADAAAHRLGLGDVVSRPVRELSHGERRQVEVAMALAATPRVLLLDEPAAGLSPSERRSLTSVLLGLDRDVTMVLIEHDMDIALRVADRVTMMHNGRVIVEGTPDEIRANQLVRDLYLGTMHDGV